MKEEKTINSIGEAIRIAFLSSIIFGALFAELFETGKQSAIVIIAVLFIAILWMLIYSMNLTERALEEKVTAEQEELNSPISLDYLFYGQDKKSGIGFYHYLSEPALKIWEYDNGILKTDSYASDRILELKIVTDEVEQQITNKKDALGRAVIGGALLGGVGAIVGAISSNQQSSVITNVNELTIELLVDDANKPTRKVKYYYSEDSDDKNEAKKQILIKAYEDVEFISILFDLMQHGITFGSSLQYGYVKDHVRLYRAKLDRLEPGEEDPQIYDSLVKALT